jgi:hypothetical protein
LPFIYKNNFFLLNLLYTKNFLRDKTFDHEHIQMRDVFVFTVIIWLFINILLLSDRITNQSRKTCIFFHWCFFLHSLLLFVVSCLYWNNTYQNIKLIFHIRLFIILGIVSNRKYYCCNMLILTSFFFIIMNF